MAINQDRRRAAQEFIKRWKNKGNEKQHSQSFWLDLLSSVYGVESPTEYITFEDTVMMDHTSFMDGYIETTKVLIEQKGANRNLNSGIRQSDGTILTPFQQAKRYSANMPYSRRPRWIITCNFKEFYIYDMENPNAEPSILKLENLHKEYYRLEILLDKTNEQIEKETKVSLEAGELVGEIYNELLKQYKNPEDPHTLKSINVLCVRLVFCFYAEDAELFGPHGMFGNYLQDFDTRFFRDAIINLFKVLDTKIEDRDPYLDEKLAAFPYVNGGLFAEENIEIPQFNEHLRELIIKNACSDFDWSEISPTIFGGVFESTLNPEERRSGGMHYTSIANIHKLIDPLFMDKIRQEFSEAVSHKVVNTKKKKLEDLQNKIASLKFLDPATGSGNFLTETYISLRRLENEILKELYRGQIIMGLTHDPIKVSISQFYGIEINDFAVSVARTALWIAESQMMKETEDIVNMNLSFLPLKGYPNIVEGNALTMDWEEVVPKNDLNYIMGNPPFLGARMMDSQQKDDMKVVFGKLKGLGNLDYVSAWYKKACDYFINTKIECAFVSTNSISQGEQVAILWEPLFEEYKININFAYQTFIWDNEATVKAHVHCVIIAFSQIEREEKYIFSIGNMIKKADNINAYLVEGPNTFIKSRRTPLSDVSKMNYGSFALDDGAFTISEKEYYTILEKEPKLNSILRPFIGAKEFINKIKRYCIWLSYNEINLVKQSKILQEKIQHVQTWRSQSTRKNTLEAAKTPMIFAEIRQPKTDYLAVPVVSSENRKYIPIGYLSSEIIASNQLLIVPEAKFHHFSIMSSNVHMSWVRAVAGRLEMRYRYSASIVYNNFPWPELDEKQKERLKSTAEMILKAREIYSDWSYADLYNELTMPPELRKAHQENDKAVMEAYGFNWRNMSESECVGELMKLYQELTHQI